MWAILIDGVKGTEQKMIMMRMRSWVLMAYSVGFPAKIHAS